MQFDFKSYREEMKFIFYVDMGSGKIWAGSEGAADTLKIVDQME